ncbi:MAG: hypothetical protein A2845_01145 [Candidatus Lloydbacteria bacterium RIFCSPHIGHO2_01_FULL_49_22]|uniref:Uncharacterized protein n=1 Tax=Candidatus Lloydbacteria bacterium RIFCSPHIGHO2_01_FULL_49_22 TaxID=1798658 RepID=A0A1G2CZ00_9BACT|nr:MAG: hypothetical protein A2845_01145 [Candidatus Lloydbacteria bacterium RIFCSPHIGHO2_01_FULL_49_22]OGZ09230.1 MAG: hypothetical protein A3C14_06150 [Candidatus Lloydbacteria bacterium RIFCSPHIGHO2_02_FULL_50_18]
MALSLIGETLTFAHDGQLLNFCVYDQNEPEGDDFVTRCEKKNNALHYGHAWFDVQNGFCTSEDMFAAAKELRGTYALFCDMDARQQSQFIYKMTMHICALIGVSACDWEPSQEFVLDAIQDELSDKDLKKAALEVYVLPCEEEPDQPVAGNDFTTDPDLIRIAQQSSRLRVLLNYDEEDAKEGRSARRGLSVNGRNRACFYSGRRALSIRRDSDALFCAEDTRVGCDWEAMCEEVDKDGEGVVTEFPDEFDFAYEEYAKMKRLGDEEYTPKNVRDERASRVRIVDSFDPWDLRDRGYGFYDALNRNYQCDCPACSGDDWFSMPEIIDEDAEQQRLIDRFGDQDDWDSFVDFGPSDREIDAIHFGHSSRLQLTGRYRKAVAPF